MTNQPTDVEEIIFRRYREGIIQDAKRGEVSHWFPEDLRKEGKILKVVTFTDDVIEIIYHIIDHWALGTNVRGKFVRIRIEGQDNQLSLTTWHNTFVPGHGLGTSLLEDEAMVLKFISVL